MGKRLTTLMVLMLAMAVAAPGAMAFSGNSLVLKKCSGCHQAKAGKLAKVEDIRTTPEEWEVIVDRMVRLHGMDLKPAEKHILLKELCSTQSLSIQEANEVAYLNLQNNPQTVEQPLPTDPEKLFVTCVRCHSAGKIHSYRMTETQWKKLRDFHLYMFPTVVYQLREMRWIPEADAVLGQVAKAQPYGKAWQAPKATPVGSWVIVGHEPGKGDYRGHASIKAAGGDYAVVGALEFADGSQENFNGSATLYGGYALRTRLQNDGYESLGAYTLANDTMRGARSFPAPDYQTAVSTWYRVGKSAQVFGVSPAYLLSGETTTLTLAGVNLPAVDASGIKVNGSSVEVLSAKRINPETIEAQVVYRGQGLQQADVSVQGLAAGTLTLAPKIDYIAVTPELGRARLSGGAKFPAEGVQFEALAYSKGANVTDPADDVVLGPVPASFKLSEDSTRPDDDDLHWAGAIKANGTYLPAATYEPIPSRKFNAEATGLVYVDAQYQRGGNQYEARARLVITDPDYIPRIK